MAEREAAVVVSSLTPKPYQTAALTGIKTALNTHDRATVVMACGTGKTLVSLWATQDAQPKTVLVLVPSLTLLQQTLGEWSKHHTFTPGFRYLCVCSDQTVGLRNDALEVRPSDVEFRIDTDPEVVTRFLAHPTEDVKVIFSTYQSSPVVGAGAAGYTFDMGIFDEAHKTTGREGGAFGYALSDERLRIRKRLFFTATPRHYRYSPSRYRRRVSGAVDGRSTGLRDTRPYAFVCECREAGHYLPV